MELESDLDIGQDMYESARDGSGNKLKEMLKRLLPEQRKMVLEQKTKDGEQLTTPLIIACRNGNIREVEVLLEFHANIEARGTVKVDDQVIEGTSPLWAAAATGYFNIVKTLLQHGANVDGRTKTNSTPLRAAAYDGRLDIVSHLVENGAGINVRNNFENTPLMVACYNGHKDVVMYLVNKGADMDIQDKQGNTVLHYAVERGHVDIVKELVKQGAKHLSNILGLNPLLLASNDCKIEMVEFFISCDECPKRSCIDALELLGATIANEPDVYDINMAFEYISRGMRERFDGSKCVFKKELQPPLEVYQYRRECQSVEELQEIKDNTHAIHMEGLLIRERILGPSNTELRFPIRYRGAVFADSANFELCISLWKHAMDIGQKNDQPIVDDLKIFGDFFCHMIQRNAKPSFRHVLDVFQHAVLEFEKLSGKVKTATEKKASIFKDDLESVVYRALYLITIFTKLRLSESEEFDLKCALYRYLCMNPRTKQGSSLIHLAVSSKTPTDDHYTKDICRYPCLQTTNLLLKNGVLVNTVDDQGNTPLHVVVATKPKLGFITTTQKVIKALLDAGIHEDLANADAKTAMDVAASEEVRKILVSRRQIFLKCIAARAIKRYRLSYSGLVPKTMETFISAH